MCRQSYGTFIGRADGTWTSCLRGNLAAGACPTQGGSGTFNSLGNGKFQVIDNVGVNIGTAIVFKSNNQNVLILDLKDKRALGVGYGTGFLVSSQQQSIVSGSQNGTWIASSTNGIHGSFQITGNTVTYLDINGIVPTTPETTSVSYNSPWTGMATSAFGGIGLLAGSGVYVLGEGTDYAEIGVKIK